MNSALIHAVVVTYFPDEAFAERVKSYASQVSHLWIVDNSSDENIRILLEKVARDFESNISTIFMPGNAGIAKAQNAGISRALENGAEWVALFDDDSAAPENWREVLSIAYAKVSDNEKIAILAPAVRDRHTQKLHMVLVWGRHGWLKRISPEGRGLIGHAATCIASGCLIRAEALRECGLMREDYFIDWVDIEFALRVQKAGWQVVVVPEAELLHSVGVRREYKLFGRTFTSSNHPEWRRYTMYRNRADVWKRYALQFPAYVAYDIAVAKLELLKILCFEAQKKQKLLAAVKGLGDGICSCFKAAIPYRD